MPLQRPSQRRLPKGPSKSVEAAVVEAEQAVETVTQENAAAVNNDAQPESTTDTGAAVETQEAVAETTTVSDLLTT